MPPVYKIQTPRATNHNQHTWLQANANEIISFSASELSLYTVFPRFLLASIPNHFQFGAAQYQSIFCWNNYDNV